MLYPPRLFIFDPIVTKCRLAAMHFGGHPKQDIAIVSSGCQYLSYAVLA